jgi:hypothetical protein
MEEALYEITNLYQICWVGPKTEPPFSTSVTRWKTWIDS